MPGAGGGGFNLRQILVILLVVPLTVFLVRQVAWHALLAATGGILFVTAGGGCVFFFSRKRGRGAPRGVVPAGGDWAWGGGWGGGSVGFVGFWCVVASLWPRA